MTEREFFARYPVYEEQPEGEVLPLPNEIGVWYYLDDESELWCPTNVTELAGARREIKYQSYGDGRWIKGARYEPSDAALPV